MALGPIFNASNLNLKQNSGTLPDVSGGIMDYFQPMTFSTLVKTVVGFQVVETPTNINFYGVWVPAIPKQLAMMPHGQRKWGHYSLYATLACQLQPDDVITYLGVQYRVLSKLNYNLYGILYYELNGDYKGAGPLIGG